jgi:hypothetical protein
MMQNPEFNRRRRRTSTNSAIARLKRHGTLHIEEEPTREWKLTLRDTMLFGASYSKRSSSSRASRST